MKAYSTLAEDDSYASCLSLECRNDVFMNGELIETQYALGARTIGIDTEYNAALCPAAAARGQEVRRVIYLVNIRHRNSSPNERADIAAVYSRSDSLAKQK